MSTPGPKDRCVPRSSLNTASRRLLDRRGRVDLPPVSELSVEEVRHTRAQWRHRVAAPGPQVRSVTDTAVPGDEDVIPIRVYRVTDAPRPVVVYLHGGGWVLGDLEHSDALCRELCRRTQAVVVNVDYRLAPEHPYPAAARDAYRVVSWLATHAAAIGGLPDRLAVAGSSAGGNLAAVAALMARDTGAPNLACQALIYPITDHRFDTASYQEYSDGYIISRDDMRWYWRQYTPDPRRAAEPYASPLRADTLARLPPTLVVVADSDPLRDDGLRYGQALAGDGVPVTSSIYKGCLHGFLSSWRNQQVASDAMDDISEFLRLQLKIATTEVG